MKGRKRDDWPAIHEKVLAADILILTSPIWWDAGCRFDFDNPEHR